jgi:thioredoxin 1
MTVEAFSDASWETDVLSSRLPVVVDFWADWCAPCKIMAPTIEALAHELAGRARVGKLNVDDNSVVSDRYGIQGIPTIMIFEGGEVKEQVVGVTSKEYLAELIEKHLDNSN